MSYLLDALKKATSVHSNDPKLTNDELQKQLSLGDSEQPSRRKLPKALASYALLAFAFTIGGFVLGDGADVVVNYQNTSSVNKAETIKTVRDETLIPFYGATHESAKYFSAPNEYNQQLIALKTEQAAQLQKEIIALQKADEKAKKQLMEQQIQSLLNQKNIQQAISANQTAKIPAQQTSVNDANSPVKLSLNRDELGDVSPDLLKAFESAIDDSNNSSVNDVIEEPEVDLRQYFAEPEIEVDLRKGNSVPVKPLAQMPQWLQNEVPSLHFSLHMYTSEVASSWVRLNGQDYYTGGMTKDGVVIEKIMPQMVVLKFQGQRFTLKALSSW